MKPLVAACRPRQWIKNGLVFVPLISSASFQSPEAVRRSALAALAFTLISSAVYMLNDVSDRKFDATHPAKKRRQQRLEQSGEHRDHDQVRGDRQRKRQRNALAGITRRRETGQGSRDAGHDFKSSVGDASSPARAMRAGLLCVQSAACLLAQQAPRHAVLEE